MIPLEQLLSSPDFTRAVGDLAGSFRQRFGLGPVDQLGVVVPDVERTAAALERRGLGPFFIAKGSPTMWRERGEDRLFRGKLGVARHQGVEIELLEPGHGSDFYARHVADNGAPMVQHLGFLARDVDRGVERFQKDGYPVLVRGRIETSPSRTDFAYLDTMEDSGFIMELIHHRVLGMSLAPPWWIYAILAYLEIWTGKRCISVK
ncbi:MAG: VOC family protein [Desulfatibacillaceae bacterium]